MMKFAWFLLVCAAGALAMPTAGDDAPIRCPKATDCPKGWTCCGPADIELGGTCVLLQPGQYCTV
ncbi:hypothetical protein CC1G_08392 [Coprinopsis cinerea okayama7|uniref:Granulins domain-containing protein n=1 Tax=Coprinopsis cinerea (strain Okayama-7 / 130 / ATCC MYA-4618 / FGSC 9003) TaxID=240176 RepID=A8NAM3_COPC7|nr:hypothetical protein CC1G_08392 [Coprinopsis cinerea okayama7\|eukprot:XP_001831875.1 hypothetical protein CC1G_08392 [Coprinopsis cinerea okayama7\